MSEYYNGPNNSSPLIATTVTLCTIAGLLAIWRFSYRGSKRVLGLSDYLLMTALILATCQAGFNIGASTQWGYGYHKLDIPPVIRKSHIPIFFFYLNQIFFKLATGCTKLSICVIYMSIFRTAISRGVRASQFINYILTFVVAGYYLGATFVSAFQCTPTCKAWHEATPGTCIDNDLFRLANAYINILTSAWIILMPFPTLLCVEHRKRELLQFLFLVALGVVHTCCAIWRLVLMYMPLPKGKANRDPQWNSTLPNTIAMVEEFIGIIAATIIVMRPCFHMLFRKITRLFAPYEETAKSSEVVHTKGPLCMRDGTFHSFRSKADNRIIITSDIELQSRNRSTEDMLRRE